MISPHSGEQAPGAPRLGLAEPRRSMAASSPCHVAELVFRIGLPERAGRAAGGGAAILADNPR
nr:MAG: hypothetical protein DIU78_04085 [Pseudomonadota bacterium]